LRSSVAANLYSDGRPYIRGAFGLSWFPSAEAQRRKADYEADIDWMLRSIYSRYTGSQVILRIAFHRNKNVVIQPRSIGPHPDEPDEDEFSQEYNATTQVSNLADATRKGDDAPAYGKDPIEDHTKGTGLGSDVLISFNPGVYKDAMGPTPKDHLSQKYWEGLDRSDCVLLHELVHAASDISGVNAEHEAAPDHYKNLEEFTAIVIANVYFADVCGAMPTNLVGGHDGTVLPLLLKDSQAFYNRYRQYMQNACDNHPELAKALKAATGIAHNPFIYCNL